MLIHYIHGNLHTWWPSLEDAPSLCDRDLQNTHITMSLDLHEGIKSHVTYRTLESLSICIKCRFLPRRQLKTADFDLWVWRNLAAWNDIWRLMPLPYLSLLQQVCCTLSIKTRPTRCWRLKSVHTCSCFCVARAQGPSRDTLAHRLSVFKASTEKVFRTYGRSSSSSSRPVTCIIVNLMIL